MKRYECLIKREKANENRAKAEAYVLETRTRQEQLRGALTPEDYYSLLDQMNEATEREWEASTRVLRAEFNLRRSHVAYCLARKAAEKKNLMHGLELVESAKGAELSLASPLALLANSVTSHAPPKSSTAMTYWQVPPRE